jgi:hypothetical protein
MDALNSEVERGLAWASCGPIVKILLKFIIIANNLSTDSNTGLQSYNSTAAEK